MLMALLVSAAVVTTAYFPYRSFADIEQYCTASAYGTVVETCSQEKEDIYYYGPQVEFTESGTGRVLHVKAVNTVNLNHTWEKDESLTVYYNPSDPSQMIIGDENTAKNRFNTAKVIAALLTLVGFGIMAAGCAVTFVRTRPKKFSSNIAGETFEEWQSRQQEEKADGIPEADMTKTEQLSGRSLRQHDIMDSVREKDE